MKTLASLLAVIVAVSFSACQTAPKQEAKKDECCSKAGGKKTDECCSTEHGAKHGKKKH